MQFERLFQFVRSLISVFTPTEWAMVAGWRLLTVTVLILASELPYRPDFTYTHMSFYHPEISVTQPWWGLANFDGVHYLNIAERGYIDERRFLPFYPLLIRFLSWPLTAVLTNWQVLFWVGILLSQGILIASLMVLKKLVQLHFPSLPFWKVLVLLLSFPTAFFLGNVYSESVFLLLVAVFFYFRKKNALNASLSVGLALVTRLTGVILLPIWGMDLIRRSSFGAPKRVAWSVFLLLFVGILPFVFWLHFNQVKWSNPWFFVQAHGQLANSRETTQMVFPLQTAWRYGKILASLSPTLFEWWVALLEVGVFTVIGLVLLWLTRSRFPGSWKLFAWLAFLVPVVSGTFSGLPRYVLVIFPVFVYLASTLPRKIYWLIVSLNLVLQLICLGWFSRGWFIA